MAHLKNPGDSLFVFVVAQVLVVHHGGPRDLAFPTKMRCKKYQLKGRIRMFFCFCHRSALPEMTQGSVLNKTLELYIWIYIYIPWMSKTIGIIVCWNC